MHDPRMPFEDQNVETAVKMLATAITASAETAYMDHLIDTPVDLNGAMQVWVGAASKVLLPKGIPEGGFFGIEIYDSDSGKQTSPEAAPFEIRTAIRLVVAALNYDHDQWDALLRTVHDRPMRLRVALEVLRLCAKVFETATPQDFLDMGMPAEYLMPPPERRSRKEG